MAKKIYPTETGYIVGETIDIGRNGGHIQGITQLGDEYTMLSSDYDMQELIVAHGVGSRKKVVLDQAIPNEYKHAGGIDALQIEENRWMIVVPVHYDKNREGKLEFQRVRSRWRIIKNTTDSQDKGAILHYFFSLKNGNCELELYHITELKGVKAYAAGIARNGNSVVVAVVIDNDGRQVLFLKYDNPKGEGKYCRLCVWEEENEDNWGHYDNSISLINYDNDYGKIYFVGLDGQTVGKFGLDLIDISQYTTKRKKTCTSIAKELD